MSSIESLIARLEPRWRALEGELGWPDAADDVLADLIARYDEPHRRYHAVSHLDAVLTVLDDLSSPIEPTADARLAAWFHDAIYEPLEGDNEERSADLAAKALRGLGATAELIDSVCALVIATKTHDAGAGPDAALLLDADLSILGADPDTYDRYAAGVRVEFREVPDEFYVPGRAAVLESFLDRPLIFATERGRARFEESARSNLRREIDTLRESERGARPRE